MPNIVSYILLIILFLILSAFFSGMEAAIFSISRFRIKSLLFENAKGATTLNRLRINSGKTLAAILLANLLVNIAASSTAAVILVHIISEFKTSASLFWTLEVILMTSLLLIFGEITPKVIALSNAEFFALKFSNIINFIANLFSPISHFLEILANRITFYPTSGRRVIQDEEIKHMLTEAKKFKVLDENEVKFSYQILKFGKKRVSEIMTPRQKVVGIKLHAPLDEAKLVISSSKHSRICVFDKKENVVGILYAKDVFINQYNKERKNKSLKDLMRKPYIVPETKQIENLLEEFRKMGIHISVIVDEFGDFSGIVTLEDILESLFGEIVDEYDGISDLPYRKLSTNTYIFDGDISIGEIARILNIEPFKEERERLSAVILEHFGKFPKEGDTFQISNLEIVVEEISGKTIEKVLIKKL